METAKDVVLLIDSRSRSNSNGAAPSSSMRYMIGTNVEVKPFPHPKRTDSGAQVLMLYVPVAGEQDGDIFELQSIQPRRHGSWFINQRVSSSPVIYVASKIDPRLLCLPFLESSSGKYSPLDQIVVPRDGCARMPLARSNTWKMEEMCDVNDKLGDDMILYRYNQDKALAWLKAKVTRTAAVLCKQRNIKATRNNLTFVNNFKASSSSSSSSSSSPSSSTADNYEGNANISLISRSTSLLPST